MSSAKADLRRGLRIARRAHVAGLNESTRALLFRRPPAPLLELVGADAVVGLYRAMPHEAPAAGYARFFAEEGLSLALPRFAHRGAAMEFVRFTDPYAESDLEVGPFGVLQPQADAPVLQPDVLFVPLLGFTGSGERLGQGGGHYDRYLEERPDILAIGLAWDVQLMEQLPVEQHDRQLSYVVTPTRLYGPF